MNVQVVVTHWIWIKRQIQMKICPNCKAPVPHDAEYCICGYKFETDPVHDLFDQLFSGNLKDINENNKK